MGTWYQRDSDNKYHKKEISFIYYNGIKIQLNQLQPNDPLIYLGVTSKIDGDQTAQTNILKTQADNIAKQLVATPMQHYYAKTFQNYSVEPKLTYSLAASFMSNKQLNSIQSKIHPEALSSMILNRNWMMELIYGKCKYRGVWLINYRVEQRVRNIKFMHKGYNI